jgi:hypothetical protein
MTLPALLNISMICSSVRPGQEYISEGRWKSEGLLIPYGMLPTKTDLEGGFVDIVNLLIQSMFDLFVVEGVCSN